MEYSLQDQFIQEWFAHPSWWFSATPEDDQYLNDTYASLCFNTLPPKTLKDKLKAILIHDQLIRHIVRHQKLPSSLIEDHLNQAVQWSHQVIDEAQCIQEERLTKGLLTWKEWCFTMLPFRHQQDISMIEEIIECLWQTLSQSNEDSALLQRFLKATYQRFPIKSIQPAKRSGECLTQYKSLCDFMPSHFQAPDYPSIRASPLGQLFQHIEAPIIVSLSGGVDSMVCTLALKAWNKPFGSIHINYDNRPESLQEQRMVEDWCDYLQIPCWTRRIQEIHREPCMKIGMRDLYESYTKTVRFNAYHQAWKAMNQTDAPKVILGHHLDDCLENTLTNIISCNKYNDLFGMEYKRLQEQVWMIRPLLSLHKQDIYAFAHQFQVPYLKDSTPEWSQRGQLRDSVIPVLKQWVGIPKLTQGFSMLHETCREMSALVEYTTQEWKNKFIFKEPNQWYSLQTIHEMPKSKLFYREFFAQMWHRFPSHRSIQEFLSRISKLEHKWDSIHINVKITCYISKDLSIQWYKRSPTQIEWVWTLQS